MNGGELTDEHWEPPPVPPSGQGEVGGANSLQAVCRSQGPGATPAYRVREPLGATGVGRAGVRGQGPHQHIVSGNP